LALAFERLKAGEAADRDRRHRTACIRGQVAAAACRAIWGAASRL
jgi:hypothetical protein